MGLLQKLKSALGLNGAGSSESGHSGDVDVTVEREPSTEDEDAVKGTETASSGGAAADPEVAETDDTGSEDPSAEEFEALDDAGATDAAESEAPVDIDEAEAETGADEGETEPDVDAEAEADADDAESEADVDDAEADADDAEADADDAEAETDADDAEADADDAEAETEGSTDAVTELNGIGPAYGDRLADAGIETVGQLAAADAAELADRIDLGESRVAGWVEQANAY